MYATYGKSSRKIFLQIKQLPAPQRRDHCARSAETSLKLHKPGRERDKTQSGVVAPWTKHAQIITPVALSLSLSGFQQHVSRSPWLFPVTVAAGTQNEVTAAARSLFGPDAAAAAALSGNRGLWCMATRFPYQMATLNITPPLTAVTDELAPMSPARNGQFVHGSGLPDLAARVSTPYRERSLLSKAKFKSAEFV